MPLQLVAITAQYSNAVLVALMPYVSHFSQRLNLPVAAPLTLGQVQHFRCDPRLGHPGGLIVLTTRCEFGFVDGRVCVYRSAHSFYSLQKPDLIPSFFGKVNLDQKQALHIAYGVIKRLGYSNEMFHAELPPKVTAPEHLGDHWIPRYRFQWLDPSWGKTEQKRGFISPVLLDIEVNASNGEVEMFSDSSLETRCAPPELSVGGQLIRGSSKTSATGSTNAERTQPVDPGDARAFLNSVLPQISAFILSTHLALSVPVTANDVDLSRYTCTLARRGDPMAQVYLTNGDRFNYAHGHVVAFYAHDAFYKFPEKGRVDDFLGKAVISTNEAISIVRQVMRNLGYTNEHVTVGTGGPFYIGNTNFTRFFAHFHRPEDNSFISTFEIDLGTRQIKSIYIDDPSLWRDPPVIGTPQGKDTKGG